MKALAAVNKNAVVASLVALAVYISLGNMIATLVVSTMYELYFANKAEPVIFPSERGRFPRAFQPYPCQALLKLRHKRVKGMLLFRRRHYYQKRINQIRLE